MNWFERLTGIDKESLEQVRRQLSISGDRIVCPNGNRLAFGRLKLPKLSDLRRRVADIPSGEGGLTIREHVGDVRQLHASAENANALFQVASQFNLLEMASPTVTPERGVGIYEHDPTQGPACAIACGAGTIYRNYFARVPLVAHEHDGPHTTGQTAEHQLDCAAELGIALGQSGKSLWNMQNGYLFPTDIGLQQITNQLQNATTDEICQLQGELRIGVQWNTPVTLPGIDHTVSQAYCSALPVAYGRQPVEDWTAFAKLVLDAAYEATLCAAIVQASSTGVNKVFLTLLGGGVFGNRDEWIISAIERAVQKYRNYDLDVAVVSYGRSKPVVADLVSRLNK